MSRQESGQLSHPRVPSDLHVPFLPSILERIIYMVEMGRKRILSLDYIVL